MLTGQKDATNIIFRNFYCTKFPGLDICECSTDPRVQHENNPNVGSGFSHTDIPLGVLWYKSRVRVFRVSMVREIIRIRNIVFGLPVHDLLLSERIAISAKNYDLYPVVDSNIVCTSLLAS